MLFDVKILDDAKTAVGKAMHLAYDIHKFLKEQDIKKVKYNGFIFECGNFLLTPEGASTLRIKRNSGWFYKTIFFITYGSSAYYDKQVNFDNIADFLEAIDAFNSWALSRQFKSKRLKDVGDALNIITEK